MSVLRFVLLTVLVSAMCIVATEATAPYFAVYTASMEPTNTVLVFAGDANGNLSPAATPSVPTGGQGYAAGTGNVQSQSALATVGNKLFVTNPGSNTLSYFTISTTDATQLTAVGSPVSTGGDWPNSVSAYTYTNGNTVACATNTGANNPGVRCFLASATGLTAVSGSDRFNMFNTTLATPPVSHTGPSQVSFTADGSAIVIIDKSPPTSGSYGGFYVYTITNAGVLSTAAVFPATFAGMVNFAGAFDTDGTFVTVDPSYGVTDYSITGTTGSTPAPVIAAVSGGALAIAGSPCWIARSPVTGHFYTGNTGAGTVSDVTRAGVTQTSSNVVGVLSPGLLDVLVVSLPSADYLYVNAPGSSVAGTPNTLITVKLATTASPSYQGNVTYTTTSVHPIGLASYVNTPPAAASSTGAGPTPATSTGAPASSTGAAPVPVTSTGAPAPSNTTSTGSVAPGASGATGTTPSAASAAASAGQLTVLLAMLAVLNHFLRL